MLSMISDIADQRAGRMGLARRLAKAAEAAAYRGPGCSLGAEGPRLQPRG